MSPARILPLREAPWCVPEVAAWLHGQWYADAGDTLDEVTARLVAQGRERRFPITFVALVDERPVGTFTLEGIRNPQTDLKQWCLSNLFVPAEWRGCGLGGQMCEAALAQTRVFRMPRLTLFTETHVVFYLRHGWRPVATVPMPVRGGQVQAIQMVQDVPLDLR